MRSAVHLQVSMRFNQVLVTSSQLACPVAILHAHQANENVSEPSQSPHQGIPNVGSKLSIYIRESTAKVHNREPSTQPCHQDVLRRVISSQAFCSLYRRCYHKFQIGSIFIILNFIYPKWEITKIGSMWCFIFDSKIYV